jgi:hypothetical protein
MKKTGYRVMSHSDATITINRLPATRLCSLRRRPAVLNLHSTTTFAIFATAHLHYRWCTHRPTAVRHYTITQPGHHLLCFMDPANARLSC